MPRQILITLLLLFSINFCYSQGETEKRLDSYIEQALSDWNIPGVSIAIVKDGKQVLAKGYGKRNVEKGDEVDSNTLFAIASNTKAFVSSGLLLLEERGQLSLKDKVIDHLPYFELYDPYVTANFTVEDLLCHRSGLATFSGDVLWYGTSLSREQIIKNAAMLEPARGFREGYGYQNIMFMAAGEVIEVVSGMAWDEFVKKEFLNPLGMTSTISSTKQLEFQTNHAEPHNDVDGKNVPIDWVNWDNMGPAGSLISSTNDISRWMMLQLGKGTLDGKTYWSEKNSDKMWTVHTPKNLSQWHRDNFPSKHFAGYGLGWDLFDYHGRMIVNHGGGYDGFISQTILVPEENLGFVILTNNNTYFPYAMMYHILDEYLAPEEAKDWGEYMLGLKKDGQARAKKTEEDFNAARVKNTNYSLQLYEYQGTYHDPKYGDVIVEQKGGKLNVQFVPTPLFKGKMEHWHHNTWRLTWDEQHMLPKAMVTFHIDESGKASRMYFNCPNPDLDFMELELIRKEE